ncbi:TraT transfer protein [Escherichia coli]|nr:TraT transfer protein [Escherichia coli]
MQHSIKDLWLYPFPEIDVVHTQEPLLPEPELTTPGRCICCRKMSGTVSDWMTHGHSDSLPTQSVTHEFVLIRPQNIWIS